MLELARVTATDLATDLAEKKLADEVRRFKDEASAPRAIVVLPPTRHLLVLAHLVLMVCGD